LSVATASDHGTVVTLTVTNSKLTVQLEEAQAYIKNLKQDIVNLNSNINPKWQGQ
jgi:hypothetical protein